MGQQEFRIEKTLYLRVSDEHIEKLAAPVAAIQKAADDPGIWQSKLHDNVAWPAICLGKQTIGLLSAAHQCVLNQNGPVLEILLRAAFESYTNFLLLYKFEGDLSCRRIKTEDGQPVSFRLPDDRSELVRRYLAFSEFESVAYRNRMTAKAFRSRLAQHAVEETDEKNLKEYFAEQVKLAEDDHYAMSDGHWLPGYNAFSLSEIVGFGQSSDRPEWLSSDICPFSEAVRLQLILDCLRFPGRFVHCSPGCIWIATAELCDSEGLTMRAPIPLPGNRGLFAGMAAIVFCALTLRVVAEQIDHTELDQACADLVAIALPPMQFYLGESA